MLLHDTAFLLHQRHALLLALCKTLVDDDLAADDVQVTLTRLANGFVTHAESVRRVVVPRLQGVQDASPALVLEHLCMTERALWHLLAASAQGPLFTARCLELQTLLLAQAVIEDSLLLPPLLFRPPNEQRRLCQAVELHELRCAMDDLHQPGGYRQRLRQPVAAPPPLPPPGTPHGGAPA